MARYRSAQPQGTTLASRFIKKTPARFVSHLALVTYFRHPAERSPPRLFGGDLGASE